ncbi:MAG: hypothetical protein Q7J47_19980 [Azoarcus sp.]|nr:hypothetical protein [Azoarcus sp.]
MEEMGILLILAAGIVVACVALLKWTGGRKAGQIETAEVGRGASFHAVEVRSKGGGCEAARAVHGKRFLSTEAPPIPLPSCKRSSCSCVYVHFDDRRSQQRRDVYLHKAYEIGERAQERRERYGRRQSDRLLFDPGHRFQ